jgi:hypothetical protein
LSQELAEPILIVSLNILVVANVVVGATSCFSATIVATLSSPKIIELTVGFEGDAFSSWLKKVRRGNGRRIGEGRDMGEESVKHQRGVCVMRDG